MHSRGCVNLLSLGKSSILHLVVVVVVAGDDLLALLDGRGGAADVAEVLARGDLGVGRAVVRHERRPRVQPKLGYPNN